MQWEEKEGERLLEDKTHFNTMEGETEGGSAVEGNDSTTEHREEKDQKAMFALHRINFVKYQPSSITAIAAQDNTRRLAVARQNSDIEIWTSDHENWIQEKVRNIPPLASSLVCSE